MEKNIIHYNIRDTFLQKGYIFFFDIFIFHINRSRCIISLQYIMNFNMLRTHIYISSHRRGKEKFVEDDY